LDSGSSPTYRRTGSVPCHQILVVVVAGQRDRCWAAGELWHQGGEQGCARIRFVRQQRRVQRSVNSTLRAFRMPWLACADQKPRAFSRPWCTGEKVWREK